MPRATQGTATSTLSLRLRGCHPPWPAFPGRSASSSLGLWRPYNPRAALTARVWAGPLSLAATRGVACLLSPPAATKMFQFAAFACLPAWPLGRVPPFGHPRVTGCLRLAAEFRRLSRPSSPLGAWASPVRPSSFLFAWGRPRRRGAPLPLAQHVNVRRRRRRRRREWEWRLASTSPFDGPAARGALQKGGVPAAPSGTATLLRLSPNYQFCPRPPLSVTDFRRPRLSWLDGRCVQGPGTYSPRHG